MRDSMSSLGTAGPAGSVAKSRYGLVDSEAAIAEPEWNVAEPDEAVVVKSVQGAVQPKAMLAEPAWGVT